MHELRRIKPESLVLLSEILAGTGRLPAGWTAATEGVGLDCDLDLVKQLTQRAATFLPQDQMDAWLAPRLHVALRLPRRVAHDDGIWAWLAFHCQEFVEARFRRGKGTLHPWRYRGIWSRNALARLWWGAEMTRNGGDYSATALCFRRTRTAQFALELMYSWDRAAAIAFSIVAEGADGGVRLTDSQTKQLSVKLKVLLTLRSLDSFGDASTVDMEEHDHAWATHRPSLGSLINSDVSRLPGPSAGTVPTRRVVEVAAWFRSIVEDQGSDLIDTEDHERE